MILELYLLNFVILFVVLQIIYCIYTSDSLKKKVLKKYGLFCYAYFKGANQQYSKIFYCDMFGVIYPAEFVLRINKSF